MEKTTEQSFVEEIQKRLKEKRETSVDAVSMYLLPQEEYIGRVAMIKTLDEVSAEIDTVYDVFFPKA